MQSGWHRNILINNLKGKFLPSSFFFRLAEAGRRKIVASVVLLDHPRNGKHALTLEGKLDVCMRCENRDGLMQK